MKNKFPYFEVKQNNQTFFMTKMPISFLSKVVNFHFRSPYQENTEDFMNSENYVMKTERETGLRFENNEKGIQRRTDLKRIKDIAKFVKESDGIVFSTPIVLSFNVFEESDYLKNYDIDIDSRSLSFSDEVKFTIIDGQHRLAGLVEAFKETYNDMEMPVTLILDADLSVATQLFIDINGNQRKVNKSMVYDLYDNITYKEIDETREFVQAVKILNLRETSPLYGRVKLLGTGTGTISQSFLVDYLKIVFKNIDSEYLNTQDIYSMMFIYFNIVKTTFPEKWYMHDKSKENSQLVKTNGIGALLLLYPEIFSMFGNPIVNKDKYKDYFFNRKDFNWDDEDYNGTGKKVQNLLKENFKEFKIN
ncbi:hypothetical protein IGI84_003073 [Enterococcus sp. DIV0008]|uniref:DGQHR domain-containing protein n=1 Tax=unclassified Enterococcus TaxID=2608891 RepID=UPI003D2FE1C9